MKKIIFFVILTVIVGCKNNDTTYKAIKYSIEEIKGIPSFYWYQIEYDSYIFNPFVVDSIANSFDTKELKIIIFSSPSCFCQSIIASFPQLIKILDSANISENNYEIYITDNISDKSKIEHPYSNYFNVNKLPSIYLLKSDALVYDLILQTEIKKISIEKALLDGIKYFEY